MFGSEKLDFYDALILLCRLLILFTYYRYRTHSTHIRNTSTT